ncbi:MAG: hypothetical protein ACI9O4_000977 [Chitinophagales bacterium]|jgi:hypothetical protein
MKIRFRIISSYWFIGAVLILLLNDFFLKEYYHNWFTGKLSDFAGLFFLPLFLSVLFPKRIKALLLASGLFFMFWKSPWSIGLIDFINTVPGFHYARVIDYTDLLALLILPLSYWVYQGKDDWPVLRISPAIPMSIAAFAMMATSQEENFTELNEAYMVNDLQSDLYSFINANSLNFENDGVYLRFNDSTLLDTSFFNIDLLGGQMSKSAAVLGALIFIDSTKTQVYLFDYQQSGGDCGFFRPRCEEPYDDKDLVLEEIETRFLDLL